MRLTVDLAGLERQVKKMGAALQQVSLKTDRLEELDNLGIELEQGIEVPIADVEINPGGLLAYKGRQVVLYIPDQGHRLSSVLADGMKGTKFHVSDCKTIHNMKARGRFEERYVVRNGLSPQFRVYGYLNSGVFAEDQEACLCVCKNCLKRLNYKGYAAERHYIKIFQGFDQGEFFSTYSSYFQEMPRQSADSFVASNYTNDWDDVSRQARERAGWHCSHCRVSLSKQKRLLHTHHVNGNKADNALSNLRVLCVDCHSKQPSHELMFVRRADRQTIQRLRREQGVYNPPKPGTQSEKAWQEAFENADPAVHGLLHMLQHEGFSVPEVGLNIDGPDGEIIFSNAELVWPSRKMVVVLQENEESKKVKELGWTVRTVQSALDKLQTKQPHSLRQRRGYR